MNTRQCYTIFLLLLLPFISGCAIGFYDLSAPRDDYKTEERKDITKALIGESQESVVEKLGPPDQIRTDGEHQYLIYSNSSSANRVIMFVFFPVFYHEDKGYGYERYETLHCLKIDIDANNLVVDYKFKSTTLHTSRYDCPSQFWSKGELQSLKKLPATDPDQ